MRCLRHLLSMIACLSVIASAVPAVAQSSPPGPSSAPSAASSGGGSGGASAPSGIIHTNHPTLYVFALSFDNPTAYAVTVEVARQLKERHLSSNYQPLPGSSHFAPQLCSTVPDVPCIPQQSEKSIWVIPEPGWTVASFVTQCQSDPESTIGAFVIAAVENDTGSFNYFAWVAGYTNLTADASFISCEPRSNAQFLSLDGKRPLEMVGTSTTTKTIIGNTESKTWAVQNQAIASPGPGTTVVTVTTTTSKGTKVSVTTPTVPTKTTVRSVTHVFNAGKSSAGRNVAFAYAPVPLPTPTPTMNMVWDAGTSLESKASQGGFPLYILAAAGGYLLTRNTQTNANCGNGCTTTNITLPGTLALTAGIFSNTTVAGVVVGGASPTRQLKNSASRLSEHIADRLTKDCDASSGDAALVWMCTNVFNFLPANPSPSL